MKQSKQSELLNVLGELALRYPNWRFGQLLANAAGWADAEIWEVEDAQLLAAVNAHLETCSRNAQEVNA